MARVLDEIVPPLSARSVALSVLLGANPPQLPAAGLVSLGQYFGVAETTMRVALSRMVSAGDLNVEAGVYSLADRHMRRQEITEARIAPRRRPYVGIWRTVIITAVGRPANERTATRATLTAAKFAELREGAWMRPDNLADTQLTELATQHVALSAMPDNDLALSRSLWDLPGWAAEARHVLEILRGGAEPMVELRAAAAAVRLLADDPVLPEELLPEGWPADELRRAYQDFRRDLATTQIASHTRIEEYA